MKLFSHTGLMLLMFICANTAAGAQSIPPIRLERNTPLVIHLKGVPSPLIIEDIIDAKGNINLPYLGELQAAGQSPDELGATTTAAYISKEIYSNVVVEIRIAPHHYFGSDISAQPGIYPDFDATEPKENK